MEKQEEKSIIKSISLLGGVQSFNILVGILRNKAVSVILGAYGMGWISLFQSTSDIISSFSNLGITTSAVKDISCANSNDDFNRVGYVIAVFRKLVLFTGFLAFFICLLGAPLLSILNFGTIDHTLEFALLAFSLFLLQQVAGYTTLLQGCRQFKLMGLSTLIGNVLGLLISIPLYYLVGIKAIVPVMIIVPFINICVFRHFSSKIGIPKIKVGFKDSFVFGANIVKTGFFICLQGFFALVYIYVLRLYLAKNGGIEYVGYFNAGMVIVNTYVGLVFNSMGTEYYPRLATISDLSAFKNSINSQINRCTIILSPLICLMMVFIPLVTRILYTESFSVINEMCLFLLASVGFKIIEWCLGFAFLAQGRTKLLLSNEVSFKIYTLLLSLLFYGTYGLVGIGYAYFLSELIFSIQSFFIARRIWNFYFDKECCKTIIVSVFSIQLCMFSLYLKFDFKYLFCTLSIIFVSIFFLKYVRKIR